MSELLPLPTIADFIQEDFGLAAEIVCKELKITKDDLERMTPELSVRLGKYFLVNEDYFWGLHLDIMRRKMQYCKPICIAFPENATNGDVITKLLNLDSHDKTYLRNGSKEDKVVLVSKDNFEMWFSTKWWDAPYKKVEKSEDM